MLLLQPLLCVPLLPYEDCCSVILISSLAAIKLCWNWVPKLRASRRIELFARKMASGMYVAQQILTDTAASNHTIMLLRSRVLKRETETLKHALCARGSLRLLWIYHVLPTMRENPYEVDVLDVSSSVHCRAQSPSPWQTV